VITTPHGLRIASLGGIYDPSAYATAESPLGFTSPYFSRQTVDKLIAATTTTAKDNGSNYGSLAAIRASASAPSQLVDILVSTAWPSSIASFSSLPGAGSSSGATPVDVVVRHTKPRYHFTPGLGAPRVFWEREPYVWDDEQGRVSRFVGLGAFGGDTGTGKKQRVYVYHYLSEISMLNIQRSGSMHSPLLP
jgi:hypothetical protein